MIKKQTYVCQCGATKMLEQNTEHTGQPIQNFPEIVICGFRGCTERVSLISLADYISTRKEA